MEIIKEYLPQTKKQWVLLCSHILGAIIIANIGKHYGTPPAMIIFYSACISILCELSQAKYELPGTLFSWSKPLKMIGTLDNKSKLWQWASPVLSAAIVAYI